VSRERALQVRREAGRATAQVGVEPAQADPGRVAAGGRAGAALALQRALGNRAVARLAQDGRVLARQPAKAPAKEDKPEPIFGWFSDEPLTDHLQLAAYYRLGAIQVTEGLKGIQADKDLAKRAQEWVDEINSWAEYYEGTKGQKISDEELRRTHQLFDIGAGIRKDIEWVADEPARAERRRAAERAEALAAEVEKLAPKMAETARAAFKAGDESLLASIADIVGNVTDIGLGIHELSREITKSIMEARGVELPAVGKYTEALGKLNKGLAAINLALSLAGEKGKTELDEGLREVGIAAGAFSSLGTLAGLPAHMGLYANLYLVPLTKACIAGIQRIAEYVHEENKAWIELYGQPGNYAVEPGGQPMWQFMVQVMKVKDESQMPTPSDSVADYFVEHRDAFNAGVGGTTKMPVSGWWSKSLDKDEFRRWLFYRRKQVWAMLYGSIKVPR
jgi:hypothetical protein